LSRQLQDHAAADCDLTTAEGRARMLAQARPLWQALPEGALKAQLQGELAIRGGLPADELARLWKTGGASGADRPVEADHAGGGSQGSYGSGNASGERRRRWQRRDDGDGLPRPQGRRQPPKRPEDRVVQMLFGQPGWWHDLPADEHDLLHHLPPPHGELIAWLERDLAEHGPRPWAVVREALAVDTLLSPEGLALADGDADPGATPADLRRAMDTLLVRELGARLQALIAESATRREALTEYRQLEPRWKEAKERLATSQSGD
jgi:DNA primase